MSEDAKSKLNEKKGAAVSEEDLEKVAGGTQEEKWEILKAMKILDPKGVDELLSSLSPDGNIAKTQIDKGIDKLLRWNLGAYSKLSSTDSNIYFFDHDYRDHAELLDAINKRAKELGLK